MCPEDYLGKNWRCPDCRTRIVPRAGAPTTLGWAGQDAEDGSVSARTTRPDLTPGPRHQTRRRVLEWLIAAAAGAGLMWWWLTRSG
jgi:hypothetical protein